MVPYPHPPLGEGKGIVAALSTPRLPPHPLGTRGVGGGGWGGWGGGGGGGWGGWGGWVGGGGGGGGGGLVLPVAISFLIFCHFKKAGLMISVLALLDFQRSGWLWLWWLWWW